MTYSQEILLHLGTLLRRFEPTLRSEGVGVGSEDWLIRVRDPAVDADDCLMGFC